MALVSFRFPRCLLCSSVLAVLPLRSQSPQRPTYLLQSHMPSLRPSLIMFQQDMGQMLTGHLYPGIILLAQLSLRKTHQIILHLHLHLLPNGPQP